MPTSDRTVVDAKAVEAKAVELYGGPDARHGNPPMTYAELPQRLKTQWRKIARDRLRNEQAMAAPREGGNPGMARCIG